MENRAAIGIVTDARCRRRGLAAIAAAANADHWFRAGMDTLEWLCVSANAGSQATARKVGFSLAAEYPTYTCVPPYENDSDQTLEQWREWDAYYRGLDAYARFPAEYAPVRARIGRILGE